MGWIKQAPSGKFKACYRDESGREHSKTFTLKRDARRFIETIEVAKAKGEWLDPRLGQVRFDEWVAEWHPAQAHLRPTTRDRESRAIRNHLSPAFGSVRLASITTQLVRTWLASLLAEQALAPATVRQLGLLMGKIMRGAVDSGLIARNPCDGVRLPSERARAMIFLDPDEIGRLAAAVPQHYRVLVLTAAYGGLRWGELVGLRVKNVDLAAGRLLIVEQATEVAGRFVWGEPKTAAGRRTVTLPASLNELLKDHIAKLPESSQQLVFPSPDGTLLRRSNFRRRVWQPAVRAAQVDKSLRFHDLRHTAVALAIAQGAHVKAIQERMGHSSAQMTLDRYGHLLPALQAELADRLDQSFRISAGSLVRPGSGLILVDGTEEPAEAALEQGTGSGASWNRTSDLTLIRGAL